MTEKKAFYLYGEGFEPQEMSLGSFVLRDYKFPNLNEKYMHPLLR